MPKSCRIAVITGMLLFQCCWAVYGQSWKDLSTRADSLSDALNYDSAVAVAELALNEAEKAFGTEDTVIATILYQLGTYHLKSRNYGDAESYFQQSLAVREKLLGADHPDVAAALYYLGGIYLRQGEYEKAEPFFQRALAVRERHFGPEHPQVAKSSFGFASLKIRQENYTEAEAFGKRAVSILEKALGPDSPEVITPVVILADLYQRLGRYTDAAVYYKRALDISKISFGSKHPQVARSMTGLANVYYLMGDYAEAEPLYKQAIQTHEKQFGANHQLVGIDLTNFGLVYAAQGKFDEAEELYRRAIEILETSLGAEHPFVGSCFSFLAHIYLQKGEFKPAESSFRKALQIATKRFGADHSEVAMIMNSLADVFLGQRDYRRADSLYRSALLILENVVGGQHPFLVASLDGLAVCYSERGQYDEALPFFERSIRIEEKVYGADHPELARTTELLSHHYRLQKDLTRSLELAERAVGIRRHNLRVGAMVMSEKDALTYAQYMRNSVNGYLSCFFDADVNDCDSLKKAADIIFSTKGEISDEIFKRRKSFISEADSVTVALAESYRLTKHQLSQLFNSGPGDNAPEDFTRELDSLRGRANLLEAELARKSMSFRKEQDLGEVNIEKVREALPNNATLVEYLRFDYRSLQPDTVIPHYLALIVDKHDGLRIIDLGLADAIDSEVAQYRRHFLNVALSNRPPSKGDLAIHSYLAGVLYDHVWKAIEDYVADTGLLIIAPDGMLNLVSFAGLPVDKNTYLIEKNPVHYLSAGRDLIRLQYQDRPGSGLFALGDPDYDANAEARDSSLEHSIRATEGPNDQLRNARSGWDDMSSVTVSRLPGTRTEIMDISDTWKERFAEPVWTYLGVDASEENFKRFTTGKRVIHLATHGYYATGSQYVSRSKSLFGLNVAFAGDNPLLLSGLFFSGANLRGEGADRFAVEDGILTAEEVSTLDLSGAQWVVLSACESGLGEVKSGEGIYGLRRAFQIAGARTIISSLWPISDKATSEMMNVLYGYSTESLPTALQKVAVKNLRELRKSGRPDHPYTWAAFIAIGDWKGLQ